MKIKKTDFHQNLKFIMKKVNIIKKLVLLLAVVFFTTTGFSINENSTDNLIDDNCGFTLTISDGDFSMNTEIDCDDWGDDAWDEFWNDVLDWLME